MQAQDPTLAAQAAEMPELPDCRVRELTIAELVAEVFESAPPRQRGRLLEPLLRPLGLLSLFAVAGGAFARARLRGGWQDLQIHLEDIRSIGAADVIALVEHAQQVSEEAVDGLGQLLVTTPVLAGSAAAALLLALLVQRARGRVSAVAAALP